MGEVRRCLPATVMASPKLRVVAAAARTAAAKYMSADELHHLSSGTTTRDAKLRKIREAEEQRVAQLQPGGAR